MKYQKTIELRDGRTCILRHCTESDGAAVLDNYILAHEQTDFLLSYPGENPKTAEQESQFLKRMMESENEIELLAEVDGVVAGLAGINAVSTRQKLKHRAELGISIDRAYWGLGIGTALTNACMDCAKQAGYEQLELSVVAENEAALSIYKKAGFVEYGRNPRGFKSRFSGYQELVFMRIEL